MSQSIPSAESLEGEPSVVIEGINQEGGRFRPSDWCERLATTMAQFGNDGRLKYAHAVTPCIINGVKCLLVAKDLKQASPEAYAFIMDFAKSNNLRIQQDRRVANTPYDNDRRRQGAPSSC